MSALIYLICYNASEKMVIKMKLIHYINGKVETNEQISDNNVQKNEKKYEFFLDNIRNNIYITDRLVFIRQNDDYIFTLEISDKSFCTLELIKEKQVLDIDVLEASYKEYEKYIDINYVLNTDQDKHHIILEIEG